MALFGKTKETSDGKAGKGGLFASAPKVGDRRRRFRLPPAAVLPVAILAIAALGAMIVWRTAAWLFWNNPDYTIKTLTVHIEGQSVTPAMVRELTGIAEGTNLFAVNLADARRQFLARKPEVRTMVLQRHMPDTMTIDVTERMIVARLGRWGAYGVDRDGWVFPAKPTGREIPVISGCSDATLKPGTRADQPVLNAIEVLDACTRSRAGERVHIASIDVSAKDWVELYLAAGERIRLAWPGMGTTVPDARVALERKLAQLTNALRASEERGRRLVNLDLTFHDQYVPAQEY